jgi:hypothetical protein
MSIEELHVAGAVGALVLSLQGSVEQVRDIY